MSVSDFDQSLRSRLNNGLQIVRPVLSRALRLGFLKGKSRIKVACGIAVLAVGLYYPVGMLLIHRINDEVEISDIVVEPGASHMIATMAALVDREVNQTRWVLNDPFFMPSSLLDNMPNYQGGIMSAVSRFTATIADRVASASSGAETDESLVAARSALNNGGTHWVWGWRRDHKGEVEVLKSLLTQTPSEEFYNAGHRALLSYNERLAQRRARFDRSNMALIGIVDSASYNIGQILGTLQRSIEQREGAREADDAFYAAKGSLYAYYQILRAAKLDYEGRLKENNLLFRSWGSDQEAKIDNAKGNPVEQDVEQAGVGGLLDTEESGEIIWDDMLENLRKAAMIDPLVVGNAGLSDLFNNNHLAGMGFYANIAYRNLSDIRDRIRS